MHDEPSLLTPAMLMRVRSVFVTLALIAVAGGIFLRIQYKNGGWPFEKQERRALAIRDSFQDMLLRGDVDQLKLAFLEQRDQEDLTFVERSERMDKRIRLMQRMVEQTSEDSADNVEARQNLLKDMMLREMLNHQNYVFNQVSASELSNEVKLTAEGSGEDLQPVVDLAATVCAISKFLPATRVDPDYDEKAKEISNLITRVATNYPDDKKTAQTLAQWVELMAERKGIAVAEPYVVRLTQSYSKSTDSQVQEPLRLFVRNLGAEQFQRSSSEDYFLNKKQEATAEVIAVLDEKLQLDRELNALDIGSIVKYVESLMMLGDSNVKTEVSDKLTQLSQNSTNGLLRSELLDLQTRLNLVGKVLNLDGVVSLDGSSAQFDFDDAKLKLIVFLHTKNYIKGMQRINQLGPAMRNDLADANCELAIILTDTKLDAQTMQTVRQFDKSFEHLKVWSVDYDSPSASSPVVQLPLPTTPYLVVLDQQQTIVSLDPNPIVVEQFRQSTGRK